MKRVEVKLNSKGVQQILKSPGVQVELLRRAEAVATEAGRDIDGGFEASVVAGRRRAHASVVTASFRARWYHARHDRLLRSIGAARRVS